MPVSLDEKLNKLGAAHRKKIELRAAAIIAEEMSLRELRKARKITQTRVAKTLGITQDGVSRLEKRSDLLLSTLRKTVEALGGQLLLTAEFPDGPPVLLTGIAAEEPKLRGVSKTRVRAKSPHSQRGQAAAASMPKASRRSKSA